MTAREVKQIRTVVQAVLAELGLGGLRVPVEPTTGAAERKLGDRDAQWQKESMDRTHIVVGGASSASGPTGADFVQAMRRSKKPNRPSKKPGPPSGTGPGGAL